ncbi:probable WRKY transcription factor 70 isoform X1 [Lathyrus oleraceus]|uniref:probable WRKY transcription factor 70 isoform X1 n=1 Tax=Pisum sativum TaxID=3888 RepID=UPI001FC638F0|nr:probable WRKY transcription factor 70 isoform X1 [Pisum sativum]
MTDVVSSKKKLLVKELLQGQEYATQLKFLLKNRVGLGSDGSASAKELVDSLLRSFSETISVMTSEACDFSVNNSEENGSLVSASWNDDMKSEDSSESKKRLLPNTKDRRGSYKRRRKIHVYPKLLSRKTDETRTIVSTTTGDIHSWRKYGQKEILNSQFPRSYFRCTRKHDQGCKATKQVQLIQEDPETYQITYIGFHTCNATLHTPQMVTFSADTNWDTFHVNSQPLSMEVLTNYIQQDSPIITSERPIVKQEYPNNDDSTTTPRSDLTDDLFDANLWSDFKDFELSKPDTSVYSCSESQNLEIDFGVFSDFSNDLVYFDERHLL